MDIINIEREKRIVGCLMDSIPLRVAKLDSKSCYNYLINHPNAEIVNLINTVYKAADAINNGWQRKMIKNMTSVGLTICCRHDKYSKILSNIMTHIYGYNMEIEKNNSFNIVEKTMLKILLKTSDNILKQRTHSLDMAHELLSDCSNDAISFIHSIISDAMKNELNEKEYNRSIQLFELLLYTLYLDTAYRDPTFWILNEISRKSLQNIIARYVKKPDDWYVNVWVRSKKLTAEQIKKGLIPPYAHSIVERRMVPAKQTYDLNKKIKK